MRQTGKAGQPASTRGWVGTQRVRVWLVLVGLLGLAMVVAGVMVIINGPHSGNKPMPESEAWLVGIIVILIGLAMPFLAITFSKVTVRVDSESFRWALGPSGRRYKRIEWGEIDTVDEVEVRGLKDWWGYGYRWAPGKGTAVVLRSGPAIRVTRSDGKQFTITVDDAAGGTQAAQEFVHHQR